MSVLHLVQVIALFLTYESGCYAWKPIVGPSGSGAEFSSFIRHSHPGAKLKLHNTVVGHSAALPLSPSVEAGVDGYEAFSLAAAHTASGAKDARAEDSGYKYGEAGEYAMGVLGEDSCSIQKFAFNHDGTVHYNNKISELEQFTICYWMRFTNHSGDHVMLTYAAENEKRALQFWVANSKNSSFLSMAIKGQQVYRLNYPLRTRQWHHICTSWNGKTGEWQVWLRAERIGRGFHNAVVGHKIPSNGKLFSGGSSITGEVAMGLHFELTLVQIYRVALSAGKAHRDHKHHHAHHFSHEGQELSTTTKAPPKINRRLPMHSLLASGQIPTNVRINLAQSAQPSSTRGSNIQLQQQPEKSIGDGAPENHAVTIHTNFINGQFHTGSRLVTQQLIGLPAGPRSRPSITHTTATHTFNSLNNPSNVQIIDETETSVLFKREAHPEKPFKDVKSNGVDAVKTHNKRELVLLQDGSIVDESNIDAFGYQFDGLAEYGGKQFKNDLTLKMNIEDEVKEHDREPAEDEVKAVMTLCGNCELEPFQGAVVFAWKNVIAQPDNVLKGSSVGRCGNF